MFVIHPVSQGKNETGCGIACVAMLGGINYDAAKQLLFPNAGGEKSNWHTQPGQMALALQKLGRDCPSSFKPTLSCSGRSIRITSIAL